MDEWITLTETNWAFWVAGLFALLEFFKWLYGIIEWLISKFEDECADQEPDEEYPEVPGNSPSNTPSNTPSDDNQDDLQDIDSFSQSGSQSTSHDAEDVDEDMPKDIANIDLENNQESFHDILGSGDDSHYFFNASEEFEPNKTIESKVSAIFKRTAGLSMRVASAFNNIKSRSKPKYVSGFTSGKLNLRRAMRSSLLKTPDTSLFMQKRPTGLAPDPMVYILIDNSGSMDGDKSRICTEAAIALVQACELTNIPSAVSCFTASSLTVCETARLKTFNQKLDQALPYFGIMHSDLYRNYTYNSMYHPFYGNVDEVTLYYVWKDYAKEKGKDKLLIVISDGCTCGSSESLKKIVKDIFASGISVIGLGIQDYTVSYIYPEYKLFMSRDDLNSLPEYLASILHRFLKGGDK